MVKLTMIDALPIITALQDAGYSSTVVGSVATRGQSDNDIDITLSTELEYDNSLFAGRIKRDSSRLTKYYQIMKEMGFKCIISPPFARIDTWRNGDILIDIWFIQPH